MSDIKKYAAAINFIGDLFHDIYGYTDNHGVVHQGNASGFIQRKLIADDCDAFYGNMTYLRDTAFPKAAARVEQANRANKGDELSQVAIDRAEAALQEVTERLLLSDGCLQEAKKAYAKYVGEQWVWVPYTERKKAQPNANGTSDRVNAVLAKLKG